MSAGLVLADLLTATRLGMALALTVVLGTGPLTGAAVVVSSAWVSDTLDGHLAQLSAGVGRLGQWDLIADSAVGAGWSSDSPEALQLIKLGRSRFRINPDQVRSWR